MNIDNNVKIISVLILIFFLIFKPTLYSLDLSSQFLYNWSRVYPGLNY